MISDCRNVNNLEFLAGVPDKFFKVGVVDPPYGIGFSGYQRGGMGDKVKERFTKTAGKKDWDSSTPPLQYFVELDRTCEDVVIFGANYMIREISRVFRERANSAGWIHWHKQNPVKNFADNEMAYSTYSQPSRTFGFRYYGALQGITKADVKIHETQKPIDLYHWIFNEFCKLKPGDRILDTHLGSGSSRIAAHILGLDFWGQELDTDNFVKHLTRWEMYLQKWAMMDTREIILTSNPIPKFIL